MKRLLLTRPLEDRIKGQFNTDLEVGFWALTMKYVDRLLLLDLKFLTGEEMNTPIGSLPEHFLNYVRLHSREYEILSGHMHSRSYGKPIEIFDPYLTIPQSEGLEPGQVVDGRFFVTRKQDGLGDIGALKRFYDISKNLWNTTINKTIFVHPDYGSEGKVMTPELVKISCYQFDETARFQVRELAVEIHDVRR